MGEPNSSPRRWLKPIAGGMLDIGAAWASGPIIKGLIGSLKAVYTIATGVEAASKEKAAEKKRRRISQDDLRAILKEHGLDELRGHMVETDLDHGMLLENQASILAVLERLTKQLESKPPAPTDFHAVLLDFVAREEVFREIADHLRCEILGTPILWQRELIREQDRIEHEAAYLKEIKRVHGKLELLGIDAVDLPQKPYDITVGYITLNLAESNSDRLIIEQADALLVRKPRLALVGPAGSGKSTLMQWIAAQCAAGAVYEDERRQGQPNPWHGCVPFLIQLRHRDASAQAVLPPMADWARATVPDWGEQPPAGFVSKLIVQGRAILMIDGLDEISAELRERFWQELEVVTRDRPWLRVYITSRELPDDPQYPKQWCPPEEMTVSRLQPLSQTQIDELIEQWFSTKADERGAPTKAELTKLASDLKRELRREPLRWLRDLAETPFLCAVISLVYYHRRGHLPENRAKLYNHCCRALLKLRDRDRRVPPDSQFDALTDDELMEIHGRIALDMLLCAPAPAPSAPVKRRGRVAAAGEVSEASIYRVEAERENVLKWLRSAVAELRDEKLRNRLLGDENELSRFLDHLKLRRSLLREPTQGKIDFHHRALQDYLAAFAAPICGKLDLLVKNAEDDRWREVILLAPGAGRIGDDSVKKLINDLLARATTSKRCAALALGCFETALPALNELKEKTLAIVERHMPPNDIDEAQALVAAGDVIIPALAGALQRLVEKPNKMTGRRAAACVRALQRIGGSMALNAARVAAELDNADIETELLRFPDFNPLELKSIQSGLQQLDEIPAELRFRIRDLSPLSKLVRLRMLSLSQTAVIDIAPLGRLMHLQRLLLNQTGVRDLTPLAELAQIERLDLIQTPVCDLTPLRQLAQLRVLHLDQTRVHDLSPLSELKQLKYLNLNGTDVSDLTPLRRLTQLHMLLIDQTNVRDLVSLTGLMELRLLSLRGTGVHDVTPLAGLKQLEKLDLNNSGVSDLRSLSHITQLRVLSLNQTGVRDLTPLVNLTQLHSLSIVNTDVMDTTPLAGLKNLKHYQGPPIPGHPKFGVKS